MKLPWFLKLAINQLWGKAPGTRGAVFVAWLEGPTGALLNRASGGEMEKALDDAEIAITGRLSHLIGRSFEAAPGEVK